MNQESIRVENMRECAICGTSNDFKKMINKAKLTNKGYSGFYMSFLYYCNGCYINK